jgi:hypothetical protein
MAARLTRLFSEFDVSPDAPRADCRVSQPRWDADRRRSYPQAMSAGLGNSVLA